MARPPKSQQEAEARAGFGEAITRLGAVFQSLPSDLALPYLEALGRLKSERAVASIAATWLKARAQKKTTSKDAIDAAKRKAGEHKAQSAVHAPRSQSAIHASRIAARDWLASRMSRYQSSAVAHDAAVKVAQESAQRDA